MENENHKNPAETPTEKNENNLSNNTNIFPECNTDKKCEDELNRQALLLTQLLSCAKGIKGVLTAILILIILWYILSFAGLIY